MNGIVICNIEAWVNIRHAWHGVFSFPQNVTPINSVEKVVIVIGLIGKATIINKDIARPGGTFLFRLVGYLDW